MTQIESLKTDVLQIGLVGLSHKTASVENREIFSFDKEKLIRFYDELAEAGIDESVYVSTCNRVEVYIAVRDAEKGTNCVLQIMSDLTGTPVSDFESILYKKTAGEAVSHLLTVASSLDSMVVGENEIMGQLKDAFTVSFETNSTGPYLNKLFHQAFKTSKQVKTETDISRNPLSVAYISVELARNIFTDLTDKRALLIGAGEMGELILKYLTKLDIGEITIANRSLSNAERIVSEHNLDASVILLDDIEGVTNNVDIVISSVSAPHYMITSDMVRSVMETRQGRVLFLVDIAVPRNIEPAVESIESVHLYNIDDLKLIADKNLSSRMQAVELAQVMIETNARDFSDWYNELNLAPAIASIQNKFNDIREKELDRYRKRKLKHLSDEDFELVEELTRQVMSKTLHNPIMNLKRHHRSSKGDEPRKERLRKKTKFVEELFVK